MRGKAVLTLGMIVLVSLLAAGLSTWKIWKQRADAEAINRAGRLRMLSQKAVKDGYLAVAGVGGAERRLSQTARAYEENLHYLLEGPGQSALRSPRARALLGEVRRRWNHLRMQLETYRARSAEIEPSAEDSLAASMNMAGDSLLAAADRAVAFLERQSKGSIDGVVRLSGMLLAVEVLLVILLIVGLYWASRPLSALREAVDKMETGEEVSLEVTSDHEIGRLAAAFDAMAEKVRRRERELSRVKIHYERIFEEAPYAIAITRPDGTIEEANQAALNLFGVEPDELPELNSWDFYEDMSQRAEFVARLSAEGRVDDMEVWVKRPDGSSFLARISTVMRPGEEGRLYQTMFEDITQERETQRRRKIFEQAVAQAGDMMCITDASGTIQYVNTAAERITGYDRGELIGKNLRILQSGAIPEETYRKLWLTLERGEVFQTTMTDRHKDGSLIHLEQTITPIQLEDGSTRFVSSARDITERIEREEQMEVLNRVLRHDIGNAATHVLGFAEVLGEADSLARREKFVGYIRRGALRITRLTQSARAIMNGVLQEEIDSHPVDLSSIVREEALAARDMYEELELSGLEHMQEPLYVEGTKLLSTVVGNLLHNAVEHSQKACVHVDLSLHRTDRGTVRLSVADDGPGVPDEKKETIFGKEEKGLESSGTGMGLYLASQVTQQCGGSIRVEDKEPTGAVFIVEVPALASEEPANGQQSSHTTLGPL